MPNLISIKQQPVVYRRLERKLSLPAALYLVSTRRVGNPLDASQLGLAEGVSVTSAKPVSLADIILFYVEDDANAVFLFEWTLEQLETTTKLFIAASCGEALSFLHRRPPFQDAPRPHLVVLDLYLPDGTGLQILENIRRHEALAGLAVAFFTTSSLPAHRQRATELNAAGFFHKPSGLVEFEQAVQQIHALLPLAA